MSGNALVGVQDHASAEGSVFRANMSERCDVIETTVRAVIGEALNPALGLHGVGPNDFSAVGVCLNATSTVGGSCRVVESSNSVRLSVD